jgi:hypothetical protein
VARHAEAVVPFCSSCGMSSRGSDAGGSRVDVRFLRLWPYEAVDFPQVDCSFLLTLKYLLSAATGSSESGVVPA